MADKKQIRKLTGRYPIDQDHVPADVEVEEYREEEGGKARRSKPPNAQRTTLLEAVSRMLTANGIVHTPVGESRHISFNKANFLKLKAIAEARKTEMPKKDPNLQRKVMMGLLGELVAPHSTKKLVVKVEPHKVTRDAKEIHGARISIKAR